MKITRHTELEVFQRAFEAAMEVFDLTKRFPKEEMYSLTDLIRRSSRSAAANITEAWRKRRYEAAFISKLSDAEHAERVAGAKQKQTEAAETQTWLHLAHRCGYIDDDRRAALDDEYEQILRMLVSMIANPEKWLLARSSDLLIS